MQRIVMVSKDKSFWLNARSALSIDDQFDVVLVEKNISELESETRDKKTDAFIIDMDATKLVELEALQRISRQLAGTTPILVVLQRHNDAALRLMFHLQVADFVTKPVTSPDLIRACLGMMRDDSRTGDQESRIYSFMPAASGNGATTLAIQAAFLLHNQSAEKTKTCIVDLNFFEGACAEYLDLEPRFKLAEIAAQPDRLDQHLLDAMISKHSSGLGVLASPAAPMEIPSIDTDVVLRILDIVAVHFDNVVIDLPKAWLPWTNTILMGANETYIVAEMTVPSMRRAQRLIQAIQEMSGNNLHPKVIVNRFERRGFNGGISAADVEKLLGEYFAGGVANNYKLVRDAVDRGVALHEIDPTANVIEDLKRIIFPGTAGNTKEKPESSIFSIGQHLFKNRA